MKSYIANFLKYRNLLKIMTLKEVKLKYRRSYLGILWSLLNPLLIMIVMTIVFSTLFKNNIENFPVYLLTGKLIFDFNSQSTKDSMGSIVSNSSIIRKIYIPKYILPLSKMLSAVVNLFFTFFALIIVMLVTGTPFYKTILLAWIPLLYTFLFSTGLGLVLASLNVFFRDMSHLYSVIITAWTYFTPIFYPWEILPEKFLFIMRSNPLYHMIKMLRNLILYNTYPSIKDHLICFSCSLIMITLGLIIFKKLQDRFVLYI